MFLILLFFFRFVRFLTFRLVFDAELKEATRMGVTLKTKEDDKEAVNNEEEDLFWSKGLFKVTVFVNELK